MNEIIFMAINMNIGGTEKALLSMIKEMDKTQWNITILMLEEYGGFLCEIPDWVKIKYVEEYKSIKPYANIPPLTMSRELLKDHKYLKSLALSNSYLLTKITGNMKYYYKYIFKGIKELEEDYDIAVAYAGPMDFITYFVANKIRAPKKIQWIHFDISKIHFNKKLVSELYGCFDNIFVVSEEGQDKLISNFPKLKNKTEVFHNIIDQKKIRSMADIGKSFEDDFDGIRILTVGRLSKEKGQDLTIPVLARLKNEGYKVRWYCIGEGGARGEYEKTITELNLKEDYVLLAAKLNPYPYMKDCDIYVQSSRYEGYCTTIIEAMILEKPIVFTKVNGSREQINNEINGLLVEINEQSIYDGIKRLLDDKNLYLRIQKNLKNHRSGIINEFEKLKKMI